MLAKVDITTKTEITDFTSPCLFKSSHLFYCRALSNNLPGAAKVPQSHLKALSFIFMIISDINKTVTKAENVKLSSVCSSIKRIANQFESHNRSQSFLWVTVCFQFWWWVDHVVYIWITDCEPQKTLGNMLIPLRTERPRMLLC